METSGKGIGAQGRGRAFYTQALSHGGQLLGESDRSR